TGLGGPLAWIRLHHVRDHWQNRADTPPNFAYRHGPFSHFLWNLHLEFVPRDPRDFATRYGVPAALADDPWLRALEATWRLQVLAAFALAWLVGGLAFASSVVAGRVTVTTVFHWFVGYAGHAYGRAPFSIDGATEEGRDHRLLGALSFGEGFHNTHHAFPRCARMGHGPLDLDLGACLVDVLARLGLVTDVIRRDDPRARKPGARLRPTAPPPARAWSGSRRREARRTLVRLLRQAHAGEGGAARAYVGHRASLSPGVTRAAIHRLLFDEVRHRKELRRMLAALGARPDPHLERTLGAVGRLVGVSCRVLGRWLPLVGAARVERRNVREYVEAAAAAARAGRPFTAARLRQLGDVEAEHAATLEALAADSAADRAGSPPWGPVPLVASPRWASASATTSSRKSCSPRVRAPSTARAT
ncbi:MAG: demethoxyubiquinone hydroxylase family protein, partial [Planctomycetia bacterium]|nr:demethoxyubiquinone hydroxylase family protein [Planctomycetia bacterium]